VILSDLLRPALLSDPLTDTIDVDYLQGIFREIVISSDFYLSQLGMRDCLIEHYALSLTIYALGVQDKNFDKEFLSRGLSINEMASISDFCEIHSADIVSSVLSRFRCSGEKSSKERIGAWMAILLQYRVSISTNVFFDLGYIYDYISGVGYDNSLCIKLLEGLCNYKKALLNDGDIVSINESGEYKGDTEL
jgi:hypothetical protein